MNQMRYFLIFAGLLFIGALLGVFAVAVPTAMHAPSWQYLLGAIGGTLLMFWIWQLAKRN
jgi:hypothetical protein